ncbi:MAG: hypothetical protein QW279_15300, partial [Candidatus Jordarchaeaceae archaeon]
TLVALAGVAASLIPGIGTGIGAAGPFMKLYNYVPLPLQAPLFSLLPLTALRCGNFFTRLCASIAQLVMLFPPEPH